MKKAIDTSKLSSDLASSSVFFRKPSPLPGPADNQPPSSAQAPRPDAPAPEKPANKETRKQPSPLAEQLPAAPSLVPFTPDPLLTRPLTRKQTFEFTKNELDFMDLVKYELRDLGITKNEMVATAVELLAKDYKANHRHSYLYRKYASRKAEGSEG